MKFWAGSLDSAGIQQVPVTRFCETCDKSSASSEIWRFVDSLNMNYSMRNLYCGVNLIIQI